jgi:hypothetical protein
MKYLKKIILIVLAFPLLALAADDPLPPPGFLDGLACVQAGDCQLADVAEGLILLIKYLLGVMGAVALLYFVIGGFHWVTSQGNQEKVRKGKDIMKNTIIALVIAFTSYLVLNFFVNTILPTEEEYQIKREVGECEGKSNGTACAVVAGATINPMACYSNKCISKCEIQAQESKQNWQCYNVANPDLLTLDVTAYWIKNICPGDEHNICFLLNAIADPADPAYAFYKLWLDGKLIIP